MDVTSITTAAASLKLAKDLLNATLGIRDFNAVAEKIAQVNDQLLKAQDSLFLHTARMADLQEQLLSARAELAELKGKSEERNKYALVTIGKGNLVYALKQPQQGDSDSPASVEPMHYLCQRCFDSGSKVVLQPLGAGWHCATCRRSFG